MAVDWLLTWGVTQVTGLMVKSILGDFAEDVIKDAAKDYVRGCFGSVFT
jgi:hypothetical protein